LAHECDGGSRLGGGHDAAADCGCGARKGLGGSLRRGGGVGGNGRGGVVIFLPNSSLANCS
jgi:hypothetical protein